MTSRKNLKQFGIGKSLNAVNSKIKLLFNTILTILLFYLFIVKDVSPASKFDKNVTLILQLFTSKKNL